jgi:hypothetical protein
VDYLILTMIQHVVYGGVEYDNLVYICANSISRCKNVLGQDVLQYVSSGVGQQVLMKDVVAITPATPSGTAVAELRK